MQMQILLTAVIHTRSWPRKVAKLIQYHIDGNSIW